MDRFVYSYLPEILKRSDKRIGKDSPLLLSSCKIAVSALISQISIPLVSRARVPFS